MKLGLDHICNRLWINHPFTANIEFTLCEFKLRELQSRVLLIVFITTECVGLALCRDSCMHTFRLLFVHIPNWKSYAFRIYTHNKYHVRLKSTCILFAFKSS